MSVASTCLRVNFCLVAGGLGAGALGSTATGTAAVVGGAVVLLLPGNAVALRASSDGSDSKNASGV